MISKPILVGNNTFVWNGIDGLEINPTNIPISLTTTDLFDFSQGLEPTNTYILDQAGGLQEIHLTPITTTALPSYFIRIFINQTSGSIAPSNNMIRYLTIYPGT